MFPAVLSFAAVLGAAAITATDVSYVRLETSAQTIEAGDRFAIEVYAYAHVPVNAVDITVQFDPSSVRVLGVDRGQSVLTIWTQDPVIEKDRVLLQGGTFRRGFLTEHKIATINVQANETGQSSFKATDVVLLAGDGSGSSVSVAEAIDSKVNFFIYDESTDPESIRVAVNVDILTDLDGDGEVTLRDISAFMGAWQNKSMIYDFNGDGRMTFRDFSIILADFFF
jgi:hypothetical protein